MLVGADPGLVEPLGMGDSDNRAPELSDLRRRSGPNNGAPTPAGEAEVRSDPAESCIRDVSRGMAMAEWDAARSCARGPVVRLGGPRTVTRPGSKESATIRMCLQSRTC